MLAGTGDPQLRRMASDPPGHDDEPDIRLPQFRRGSGFRSPSLQVEVVQDGDPRADSGRCPRTRRQVALAVERVHERHVLVRRGHEKAALTVSPTSRRWRGRPYLARSAGTHCIAASERPTRVSSDSTELGRSPSSPCLLRSSEVKPLPLFRSGFRRRNVISCLHNQRFLAKFSWVSNTGSWIESSIGPDALDVKARECIGLIP